MKIYDITRELRSAPLYPGTPEATVTFTQTIQNGDTYNLSQLFFDSHTGTHCDAFLHYIEGESDIAQIPLAHYIGTCQVLSAASDIEIDADFLARTLNQDVQRVLLKSGGTSYLSLHAAKYLVSRKLLTVGTDAWSIAPLEQETPIHQTFLSAHVAIIEQLDLSKVEDGIYFLYAPPLKISGAEAAPCRAVLLEI